MTLAIDDTIITFGNWTHELSEDDWLSSLWGIRRGETSSRRGSATVHPSAAASAGWLHALWGFTA